MDPLQLLPLDTIAYLLEESQTLLFREGATAEGGETSPAVIVDNWSPAASSQWTKLPQ